eukprot:TRINITY_DN8302_c0_g1_i15.p1 TRINITY_DN8302_c0_g1~~TRINITY_DN8302_c0_g1_i15.p1  ORF type:complete len:638 (-),score=172.54 TRINITY_DN8302_c0_g1_i15:484-2397(-)
MRKVQKIGASLWRYVIGCKRQILGLKRPQSSTRDIKMGIFSNSSSPFDQIVEKVTDEKSAEDWGLIMEVCDRVQATNSGPKDCLKSIYKRLNHQDPHVVLQAVVLLDACINNCGQYFLVEVASREFETEFRKLLTKSHPKVQEKLKLSLKKWAEGEFSKDSKYSLIPTLYNALKREGYRFTEDDPPRTQTLPKDPNVVASKQEEDDIAKAIQLSLESSKGGGSSSASGTGNRSSGGGASAVNNSNANSSLYPSADSFSTNQGSSGPSGSFNSSASAAPDKDQKKARCLYDFEAAEDNELTFKAGEIVVILDDEDANWWKGSNHRGEGLFPANFVTLDLSPATEKKKSVQFNEEVEVNTVEKVVATPQLTIDEEKIDQLLSILHEADPLDEEDPPSLPVLEEQVGAMGPMIDNELEKIDRQHAKLTRLSRELVESLQLYHTLMAEMPPSMPAAYAGGYPGMPAPGQPAFMPGQPMAMPGMGPGMMGMPHVMPNMPGMPVTSMPGGGMMPTAGMAGVAGAQQTAAGGGGAMMPAAGGGMQPQNPQQGAMMPGGGLAPGQPQDASMQQTQQQQPGVPPTSQQQVMGGGMPGMYYMEGYGAAIPPTSQQQGGGYIGSAPPPTPPLYDPNMGQAPASYIAPQ